MDFNDYVATGEKSFYYNHSRMLEDAKNGMRIIENTDFQKYENQRLQNIKNHYEKRIKQEKINAVLYNNGIIDDCFSVAAKTLECYRELLQSKNKGYLFF